MSGERSERPTARRLKEARREGRVARSPDVATWVGMLVASLLLPLVLQRAWESSRRLLMGVPVIIANPEVARALDVARDGMAAAAWAVLPLALGVMAVGVLANTAQGGFSVAPKLLRPQFKRLSPITGLKRMLGPQAMWEAAKILLKTALLAFVVWRGVVAVLPLLTSSGRLPLATVFGTVGSTGLRLMRDAAVVGLLMALADYAVVRRRTGKQLRMTKQEVKEEHKRTEGDPHVRGAIRSRQMAMSRNRMMAEVSKADVVVVNPTHVAVALRYDPSKGAPRVVAKGAGVVAARIRDEADRHRVPMVQDVPLARALHQACELGQEIPAQLYTAVARVLAFVLALKARGSAAGVHRPPALSGSA